MKKLTMLVLLSGLLVGCGGAPADQPVDATQPTEEVALLTVEPPAPLEVPEPVQVKGDDDWEAKVHNKDIEIVQVINVINPVAAYITEGFNKYGDSFSETLQEEWTDTQAQLTQALTLYESCKERRAAAEFDKQLFLDHEEVWQLLVKTGVAGVRSKSMVDTELRKLKG